MRMQGARMRSASRYTGACPLLVPGRQAGARPKLRGWKSLIRPLVKVLWARLNGSRRSPGGPGRAGLMGCADQAASPSVMRDCEYGRRLGRMLPACGTDSLPSRAVSARLVASVPGVVDRDESHFGHRVLPAVMSLRANHSGADHIFGGRPTARSGRVRAIWRGR